MKERWAAPPPEQWEAEAERLISLLRYFNILYTPNCWLALALELARKHYPKGAPNPVGRPRRRTINKLAQIAALLGPKRQRGRPKSDFGEQIAKRVDAEKQRLGLSGHESDKKALESMVRRHLPGREGREFLAYSQKALSRQRGKAAHRTIAKVVGEAAGLGSRFPFSRGA